MKWWSRLRELLSVQSGETWMDLGRVEEFPVESVRTVEVRGTPIAVFHTADGFHAIGDVCPHMGASLSEGTLDADGLVQCAAHTIRFSLQTGKCAEKYPYEVRVFPTRVHAGNLFLRV